jgi:hypothetical protein
VADRHAHLCARPLLPRASFLMAAFVGVPSLPHCEFARVAIWNAPRDAMQGHTSSFVGTWMKRVGTVVMAANGGRACGTVAERAQQQTVSSQ